MATNALTVELLQQAITNADATTRKRLQVILDYVAGNKTPRQARHAFARIPKIVKEDEAEAPTDPQEILKGWIENEIFEPAKIFAAVKKHAEDAAEALPGVFEASEICGIYDNDKLVTHLRWEEIDQDLYAEQLNVLDAPADVTDTVYRLGMCWGYNGMPSNVGDVFECIRDLETELIFLDSLPARRISDTVSRLTLAQKAET